MKLIVFIISFFFLFSAHDSASQKVSGTIIFEDGSSQNFLEVLYLLESIDGAGSSYEDGIMIEYNNSHREVDFEDLIKFEIKSFGSITTGDTGDALNDVLVNIETATGIETDTKYEALRGGLINI